jgi:subtilisin family serine protease
MRIVIWASFVGCAALLGCSSRSGSLETSDSTLAPHVPNRVVVKYTDTHAQAAAATRDAATQGIRNQLGAFSLGELDGSHRFELLDVSASGVSDAIEQLRADEHVEIVEPDYLMEPYAIPNDLFFNQQWSAQNTGQFSGTPGADVDLPAAWDMRTDCRGALVAVIDGPVALPHEDLSMWVNPGEDLNHNGKMDATDLNGVDDDGDGFVDDVSGWDFLQNDNDVTDQTIDAQHASAVSGIIGAHGNNGLGMAGVCWAADILPLRFMQGVTGGANSDAIRAINYAVARGAKVINASWGSDTTSAILEQAIADAGNAGTLFVAAAGNSARNIDQTPTYPAGFPEANIVSVIASDPSDQLASSFSNFGANNTDLAAPGVTILGTTGGNGYTQESGTSFAAPLVAGAAAMLFAANPSATVAKVKDALLSSVDKLPAFAGLTSSGGRLNVHQALLAIGSSSGGSFHARIQAEDYIRFNETTPSVNYGAAARSVIGTTASISKPRTIRTVAATSAGRHRASGSSMASIFRRLPAGPSPCVRPPVSAPPSSTSRSTAWLWVAASWCKRIGKISGTCATWRASPAVTTRCAWCSKRRTST